jgi:hypothetical protein
MCWRIRVTFPLTTFQTGVVHMDACLNLDPASPRQADCDHAPRDLAVLVHWVHHPRFGDFLIDTGFDDSFAKHPPYGSYTEAMKFFNWANGVTNRQEPGMDLGAQLARLNVHPKAVFFTHLTPITPGAFPHSGPRLSLSSARPKPAFWRVPPSRTTFQPTRSFSASIFRLRLQCLPSGRVWICLAMGPFGPSPRPVIPTTTWRF